MPVMQTSEKEEKAGGMPGGCREVLGWGPSPLRVETKGDNPFPVTCLFLIQQCKVGAIISNSRGIPHTPWPLGIVVCWRDPKEGL